MAIICRHPMQLFLATVFFSGLFAPVFAAEISRSGAIKPYVQNNWYWELNGEPILLRGATDDHSLFQWTGKTLTDHLDLLVSVGGNYVRNTLSDRQEGNVYAFGKTPKGAYDLETWNEEYWRRLRNFLDETARRGIVVQLTLWDHFDVNGSRWDPHPWNPKNNINMDTDTWESYRDIRLAVTEKNGHGLKYLRRFVDKALSVTLAYNHILYNINNESSEGRVWEDYWANFIHQQAQQANRKAYVTTMQFDPGNSVRTAMSSRDIYNFVEISQNNQDSRGGRGLAHWNNIMNWRTRIASHASGPMPMNNEKIYGGKDGVNYAAGSETEAVNRFWRNVFAGCASVRFHRPAPPRIWGSGLNPRVQNNLKAMDMLLEKLNIFEASPHNDLLSRRVAATPDSMEAYATAEIGSQYAVYFPQGRGAVHLDPWVYVDELKVTWLDIDSLTWSEPERVKVQWEGGRVDWGDRGDILLKTPTARPYVAFVEVAH